MTEIAKNNEEKSEVHQADDSMKTELVHLPEEGKDTDETLELKRLELELKERELTKRQLLMDTEDLLRECGLPIGLSQYIMSENLEDTKKAVHELKEAFDMAVQVQVSMKFRGTTPSTGTGITGGYRSGLTEQVRSSLN